MEGGEARLQWERWGHEVTIEVLAGQTTVTLKGTAPPEDPS